MPDDINLYFFVTIRDLARNDSTIYERRVEAVQSLRHFAAQGFVVCSEYLLVPEVAAFAKTVPE